MTVSPPMTCNIDVDPDMFDELAGILRSQLDGEGTRLFLFHRRKPAAPDSEQRAHLLGLVKKLIDDLLHQPAEITSLHLIDCSGDDECLHSDLLLLAEILQSSSEVLEPDTTADVVLMDYVVRQDEGAGSPLGDVTVRSLGDASVVEDRMVQALQALDDLDPNVGLRSLTFSEQEIASFMDDVMRQLKADLPNTFSETRLQ